MIDATGQGHTVRALARSDAAADRLIALGVEAVRADLFDRPALTWSVAGADAILHLATHIPPISQQRNLSVWDENDRIRRDGTRHLVDAALENGVRVFVYPSVAFVYPSSGDRWVDATGTPAEDPPQPILRSTRDAELEVERFSAAGRRGIVLRMAALNGPDAPSSYEMLSLAGKGVSPIPGPSNAFHPSILVADAAAALVAALADRVPPGIYDVGDDEPLTGRELPAAIASAAGRRSLRGIPMWLLRIVAPVLAALAEHSVRLSNRRFREVSGWAPTIPNAQLVWARTGQPRPAATPIAHPTAVTLVLAFFAVQGLGSEAWLLLDPAGFDAVFPGLGHMWVSVDGPYNEHLLRDFGAMNLALGVVTVLTLQRRERGLHLATGLAWLAFSLPHFLYHLDHLSTLASDMDRVLQTVSLGLTVLLALSLTRTQQQPRPCLRSGATRTERTHV